MKKVLRLSAVMLLIMALLLPMLTVSAAAATRWNGTSTLKAGKSYVITSAVTMDSKFTIPAKATLTISNGGSLTVSKGVTVTVNGTLSVAKGGTLKVNGTLNAAESSCVKISGKFTYGASAKIKLNGSYTVSSTGTVSGSGTAEINLSAKSQYNSDINKINTYLEKKNYSKACSLLESAIKNYPDKKTTLQKAYSSAVIDWADQYADNGDYTRACSVLSAAKTYLSDKTDVTNRYDFYQGYIPVRLLNAKKWAGDGWCEKVFSDNYGNQFSKASYITAHGSNRPNADTTFIVDGKFTNFKATLACASEYGGGIDCYLEIYVDDMLVYESEAIYKDTKPFEIDVDITGARLVRIHSHSGDGIIVDSATFYKK
ncbi:MAG: NPCBM/NEW2 domain-containing protein [Oscillospiraceae bacterium]